MNPSKNIRLFHTLLFSIVVIVLTSCQSKDATSANSASVVDSVKSMATHLVHDLAHDGPKAWLTWFEDSPDFSMASDGALVFKNYAQAKLFVNDTLSKRLTKIDLRLDHPRIDPLSDEWVEYEADFSEVLTTSSKTEIKLHGYFTGLAHKTNAGWKWRSIHWSAVQDSVSNRLKH